MSTRELGRETYRRIIETYFRAFGTGDFSHVQFSSQVQFLSPLSDTTVNGREAVSKFCAWDLQPCFGRRHHVNGC